MPVAVKISGWRNVITLKLIICVSSSGFLSAKKIMTAPNAPTDVMAEALSSSSIQLTWTDNATDETGFIVQRSTSEVSGFLTVGEPDVDATSFLDETLPDHSTTYYYRVAAKGATENSAFSEVVNATTLGPEAPSDLTATTIGATFVTMEWQDNTNSETAFVVERSPGGGANFSLVGEVGADVVTFTDNGAVAQTIYDYRAAARVDGQLTDYSNILNVTTTAPDLPASPGSLTATVLSPNEIRLNWSDLSNNETGFRIQRSDFVNNSFKNVGEVDANVKTFTNSGLQSSSKYWFRVVAFNTDGTSAPSGTVTAVTDVDAPEKPTGLKVFAISTEGFEMEWSDNSDVEDGYKVQLKQGDSFTTIAELEASSEAYTVTGLSSGTSYRVRVAAFNGTGESLSSEVGLTTLIGAPDAPTSLSIEVNDTGTEISLSWVDNSDNETGFEIEKSIADTENFVEHESVDEDVTNFSETIEADQKVFYRVRAVNDGGFSDYSNITGNVVASVSEVLENDIRIYPNPTDGHLRVTFANEAPQLLHIYSYTGQRVETYDPRSLKALDIDLSDKPEGLYFIKLQFSNVSVTRKLLLTK